MLSFSEAIGKLFVASKPSAYLRCFILMPGSHDISLPEIEGVSLKLVVREVMVNHQGLKYWVAAYSADADLLSSDMEKILGARARADLFDLMFFKKPPKHDGFLIDSKGVVFEDGKKVYH